MVNTNKDNKQSDAIERDIEHPQCRAAQEVRLQRNKGILCGCKQLNDQLQLNLFDSYHSAELVVEGRNGRERGRVTVQLSWERGESICVDRQHRQPRQQSKLPDLIDK